VEDWIKEIKQLGSSDVVIAIAGNKCDLEKEREIPTERGAKYAKSVGALFSETSAKTGVNVQELFTEISKALPSEDCSSTSTFISPGGTIILCEHEQQKQKRCC
jgi:GTPase SAR1 family protein